MSKNCVFKIKILNFFVISNGASCHGASCHWGELSVGRVVMGRVVHGASCPWGELSLGRVVPGASCPWGELSMGRVVPGASCRGASLDGASCLWGELSWGEWSGNHYRNWSSSRLCHHEYMLLIKNYFQLLYVHSRINEKYQDCSIYLERGPCTDMESSRLNSLSLSLSLTLSFSLVLCYNIFYLIHDPDQKYFRSYCFKSPSCYSLQLTFQIFTSLMIKHKYVFATKLTGPRINACFIPPSCGLFLTFSGKKYE
jgi:hypothetical protein